MIAGGDALKPPLHRAVENVQREVFVSFSGCRRRSTMAMSAMRSRFSSLTLKSLSVRTLSFWRRARMALRKASGCRRQAAIGGEAADPVSIASRLATRT